MNTVEVANAILIPLGGERITSLTDGDSENAKKLNGVWNITRRKLLRQTCPGFAKKEKSLARATETPVLTDYAYCFQKPSDYVRLTKTDLDETDTYKIKGQFVYSNEEALAIEYIADITDPNKWDDSFMDAFICDMRSQLAFAITGKAEIKAALDQDKITSRANAASISSQEVTPDKPKCGSWIRGRG